MAAISIKIEIAAYQLLKKMNLLQFLFKPFRGMTGLGKNYHQGTPSFMKCYTKHLLRQQFGIYVSVFQPMNRSKKSSASAVKKLRDRVPIREVRPRKLKINQTVFIERIILTAQFSASLVPIDQGRHQGNQRNCTPVLRSS